MGIFYQLNLLPCEHIQIKTPLRTWENAITLLYYIRTRLIILKSPMKPQKTFPQGFLLGDPVRDLPTSLMDLVLLINCGKHDPISQKNMGERPNLTV